MQHIRIIDPTEASKYVPVELLGVSERGVTVRAPALASGGDLVFPWSQIHPMEAFVCSFYERWNAGDLPTIVSRIHPEYRGYLEIGARHITTTGRSGFQEDRIRGAEALQGVHIDPLDVVVTDTTVEVHAYITATQRMPYGGVGKAGDAFVAHTLGSWMMVDGMIAVNHEKMMIIPQIA